MSNKKLKKILKILKSFLFHITLRTIVGGRGEVYSGKEGGKIGSCHVLGGRIGEGEWGTKDGYEKSGKIQLDGGGV